MEIETLMTVPAVLLAVEAFKYTGYVHRRFLPVLAVACGVLFGALYGDPLTGALLGLSASGVFSGAKTLAGR